jgi:hypothetical protein
MSELTASPAPSTNGPSIPTGTAERRTFGPIAVAGLASIGAGTIHALAAGLHAENAPAARTIALLAAAQIGAGLWALVRQTRVAAAAVIVVSVAAVAGWLTTRLVGISFIGGLETSEAPQFADSACAALGLVAAGLSIGALVAPSFGRTGYSVTSSSMLVGGLVVASMIYGSSHAHGTEAGGHHGGDDVTAVGASPSGDGHTDDGHTDTGHADTSTGTAAASDGHSADGHSDTGHAAAPEEPTAATDGHGHGDDATTEPAALAWPRPWDPSQPIDLGGVEGVTAEQQLRAIKLVEDTLRELPKYADPAVAIADGYTSIGDGVTGSEHFIKGELIEDDVLLDPTAPESLVYTVKDGQRTLAGAMFIASARPADDPSLTEWAGPLMTWHKHDNLCWALDDQGVAKVVGIIDAQGNCANGVRAGGENPMVHVWIEPHPCGVFAALEGIGAGTAAVPEAERVDMCAGEHHAGAGGAAEVEAIATPKPYDPTKPIDLSGTPGVTEEQQAAAENLVAVTVVRLPKWSDYKVAEAAGFRSIGDGSTGHEHYIQWDWINDDITLDPDFPESLVYEPQPDGTKKLVSAMYMLPDDVALEEVPDIGGALMQWHIHDNLCFTNDPDAPRVAGITDGEGGCPAGLQKFQPAPMIHVWITPHKCGPFAALEGLGAGQIVDGEERLCDHAHGSGGL